MEIACYTVNALAIKIEYQNRLNNSSIDFKQSNHMQISTTAFKLSPKLKKFENLKVNSSNLVV